MTRKLKFCICVALLSFLCLGSFMVAFAAPTAPAKITNAKVTSSGAVFYSATRKGLSLELNAKVPEDQLRKQIRIKPTVGFFTVERNYHETKGIYRIYGKFVGGQKYELSIVGGPTESGEFNIAPFKEVITAKEADKKIEFTTRSSVIELKSRQTLPLRFQHVNNFKAEFSTVPPFFSPEMSYLTIDPEVDERDYNSSTSSFIPKEFKKYTDDRAKFFDFSIESLNLNYAKSCIRNCPDVADFLGYDISTKTQAFMGSENPDNEYNFALPLELRNEPEKGGIVVIKVTEEDKKNPAQALRTFQVTDMSITYKFSKRELLIWVTSISQGKPLADIPVMLYDGKVQRFFPGRTDKDGLLIVDENTEYPVIHFDEGNTGSFYKAKLEIAQLMNATVATHNDSAFVVLNADRLYSSIPMASPDCRKLDTLKAYAFTDRGVYRPGEKVNWKVAFREYKDNKVTVPSYDIKANVVIKDARDAVIYEEQLPLTPYGTLSGTLETKSFMPRGYYNISIAAVQSTKNFGSLGKREPQWDWLMQRQAEVNNEKLAEHPGQTAEVTTTDVLYNCGFQVQDFEAPRHFVDMTMSTTNRKVRQIVGRDSDQAFVDCKVTGKYYAGGVLRNAKVQWSAYLIENVKENKAYPEYTFGNNDFSRELLEQGNSVLNKDGELVLSIPMSKAVMSGLNQIEFTATVLDVDGKPATSVKAFAPTPAVRVGISKVPSSASKECDIPVKVIAIDNSGNRINAGNVTLEVMRKKWIYVQKRASDGTGGLYYNWQAAWTKSYSLTQGIKNSEASFNIAFPEGGDYLLRAHYINGQTEAVSDELVTIEYSYASYSDLAKKSRTRSANEIFLTPEKEEVAAGQPIKIKYTLPRLCDYALVTVETGDILDAKVIKLNGPYGEFTETMTDECRPNAFISFIAPSVRSGFPVYSIDSDTEYPRTYFGFTSLKVQSKVDSLKVVVASENQSELKALPGQEYTLNFKVTDAKGNPAVAEVAVGVVDESVLALTGYVTPVLNSLRDFFMPLSVFTGDLRVALINQELFKLLSTRILTGGGEGVGNVSADLKVRKDFRPVAYFKGDLVTKEDGSLSVSFKLPDTMTSYRVYAVANDKGSCFGSTDRQLRVTKDYYIEPSVPSFLSVGDKATVIATHHNKTTSAGSASLTVVSAKGVTATLGKETVSVEGLSTAVTTAVLEANKGATPAKITLKGTINSNVDAVEESFVVNPASVLFKKYAFGSFKNKETIKADIPAYVTNLSELDKAGTLTGHISISRTPWTKLVPTISYLMDYPHGCVEQTASRIIGLAAIRKFAEQGVFKEFSLDKVDKYLQAGLDNLLKMQTSEGGFSYWSSETSTSWWGTQYAAYALTALKESGYEVNPKYLDSVLNYVKNTMLSSKSKDTFKHPAIALGVIALAKNNKITFADLTVIANKFTALKSKEAEAMLTYAECFIGETSLDELGFKLLNYKPSAPESHDWMTSSVRRDAFVLLANCLVKGAKKTSDAFAGNLFKTLTAKGYWTSTADTGIALSALAAYFGNEKPVEDKDFTVKVILKSGTKEVNLGKAPESFELTGEDLTSEIKIESQSKSLVNYTLAYTHPEAHLGSKAVNNGFEIEKTIENMNGAKEIRVGDIVKVTFIYEKTGKNKGNYQYLVLEDPIPAGFTAINPSLKNDAIPADASAEDEEAYCDFSGDCYEFYASHKELRNDALVAYKDYNWDGRFKLTYYLRATCQGSFIMKPSQVSLMYQPEVYGLSKATTIQVLP